MVMRHTIAVAIVVVPFTLVIALSSIPHRVQAQRSGPAAAKPGTFDAVIEQNMGELFRSGGQIFRFDTFGDERFWSGTLKLDQAIGGARFGGVGPGVSPATALAVGPQPGVAHIPPHGLSAVAEKALDLHHTPDTPALFKSKSGVGHVPLRGSRGP